MRLVNFMGIVRRTVIGDVPVARLFSNDESGLWFDPSDLSTMFQDTAGTSPVTATGQLVARINDKSGNGNNGTQATEADRPIYGIVPSSGRRNKFTFSEDMSNAAWVKINSSVTAAASIGGYPMWRVETTAVPSPTLMGRIQQLHTLPLGLNTWMAISTANEFGNITMGVTPATGAEIGGTAGAKRTVFNTGSETFTASGLGTGAVYAAEPLGGGLWKITLTFDITATGDGVYLQRAVENVATDPDSIGRFFLAGPTQLELGSTATAYQRVTDQYNVTEAGVASNAYLQFDGTDDFLATGTITPGTDKAQVFAGVRSLDLSYATSADIGMVMEIGGTGVNALSLRSPNQTANGLGLVAADASVIKAANITGLTPPVSSILAGRADTAGDSVLFRRNGGTDAAATSGLTAANFAAKVMYIGGHGGTHRFLNGQIFSLITRFGPNLTPAELERSERYVASKTSGASI